MKKCGILLAFAALFAAGDARDAAAQMQPGQWRFTQRVEAGGRASTKTKARCVTPAQAKDPVRFFAPAGRGCTLTSNQSWAGRISSSMTCKTGNATSTMNSTVRVSSPTQISISATMTTTVEGRSLSLRLSGTGERVGECGRRPGRRQRG